MLLSSSSYFGLQGPTLVAPVSPTPTPTTQPTVDVFTRTINALTPTLKLATTAINSFGPVAPVSTRTAPVGAPTLPNASGTVVGQAAVSGSEQTGLTSAFDARKFFAENQKEIMQVLVVGALIWLSLDVMERRH